MSNKNALIELVGISKNFGSASIIKNIDLIISESEFVVIKGKSGVGKTSLFRILALLDLPSGGNASYFGEEISVLSDDEKANLRLRKFGLVFQFFNLLPSLTVIDNIELPMALAGIKKPQRRERALDLLSYFDLKCLAERFPMSLSGGEKQRVAVMRALVNSPALMLADEPTSSIDDENSTLLVDLLRKISRETGMAVVITTTDLYERLPADKTCLLKDGYLFNV